MRLYAVMLVAVFAYEGGTASGVEVLEGGLLEPGGNGWQMLHDEWR